MYPYEPRYYPYTPGTNGGELYAVLARLEERLERIERRERSERDARYMTGGLRYAAAPSTEMTPIRFRETEANLYADLYIPYLTAGDVEVEISGNRILLQTRVPVAPVSRWLPETAQLPRGFELFELPDGRIELSWVCPVPFQAKEVTACFRDGFLLISVPKSEAASARHTVKVTKEAGRRAANEMNS